MPALPYGRSAHVVVCNKVAHNKHTCHRRELAASLAYVLCTSDGARTHELQTDAFAKGSDAYFAIACMSCTRV